MTSPLLSSDCATDNARPLATVRRAFVDTPAGQIHVRIARPEASSAPPLLLLHQSPASSLTYLEILPYLGRDRVAIAVDTPGFGESFRPAEEPSIADYARWISAVPASLGYDKFDLFGLFTGAAIASEITRIAFDRVRKLILAGPPLFTPEQQARFLENAWPMRPQPDGSHLLAEWNRVMTRSMPGLPFERRADAFNEFYRGGANAIWGEMAVSVYPLADTLPQIKTPTLILEPEGVHSDCEGALAMMSDARLQPIPHLGYSMLQVIPDRLADIVCGFLTK